MEVEVSLKNARISPKKARIVAKVIVGARAKSAQQQLRFMPQKAAYYLSKLLSSGLAAAEDKDAEFEKLNVKALKIDQAPLLKRIKIKSRGRTDQIRKKRCHFTLILSDQIPEKPSRKDKEDKEILKRGSAPASATADKDKKEKYGTEGKSN